MKKAQVAVFVIIGVLLASSIILTVVIKNSFEPKIKLECQADSDCVPEAVCHPSSCVLKSERQDDSGLTCTQECKPGTLDCGQGYCACIKSHCKAVIDN